jgi:HlyD family secretion protein
MQNIIKILLILFVSYSLIGCAKPPEEKEIKKSKDTIEIVFEGIITPSKEEKLLAPISGKINKTYAEKGKKVTKNQRLAEFDRHELEVEYRKAKAEYEKTLVSGRYYEPEYSENRVIIHNAKERLLKTYDLYKANLASLAELKVAEDSYMNALAAEINRTQSNDKERFDIKKSQDQARKDMEKARLDIVMAKYNLAHSSIMSHIDGYLAEFKILEGQEISKGDYVGSVIDIDNVVLKGAISPGSYKYIKTGNSVDVSCITTPPLKLKGTISEVSPLIDPESGRMSLYIPLKNQDYLLQPGVKCLISKIMTKKQAEEVGIPTKEEEEKSHIKSDIKSPEVK